MNRFLRFSPLWLLLLVVLAYGSALPGDFYLADARVIEGNENIRSLDRIPAYFVDASTFSDVESVRHYRPLTLSLFALTHRGAGPSPWAFTLVSILLHWLVVLVAFFLARSMLMWVDSDELAFPSLSEASVAALLAAALFAVHTATSASVNHASAQAVLLATLGCLTAVWAYGRWLAAADAGESRTLRWRWPLLALLAQIMALGSMSIAITLPLVLLAYDWLFARRSATRKRALIDKGRRLMPFVLVSIAYVWWRNVVLGTHAEAAPYGVVASVLTQIKATAFYYLKMFLWPVHLSVDPEFTLSTALREPEVLGAIGVLVALVLALVLVGQRFRVLAFCGWWALITLASALLFEPAHRLVSEHRIYLPFFGLVLPIGLLVVGLAQRLRRLWIYRLLISAFAVLMAILIVHTNGRNRVWQSPVRLWGDAAGQSAAWHPHMMYAQALEEAGDAETALAEFERAASVSNDARPHLSLGLAYLKRDRLAEGLEQLRAGVQRDPDLAEGRFCLGYGHEVAGALDDAVREYRAALRLDPAHPLARRRLAELDTRDPAPREIRPAQPQPQLPAEGANTVEGRAGRLRLQGNLSIPGMPAATPTGDTVANSETGEPAMQGGRFRVTMAPDQASATTARIDSLQRARQIDRLFRDAYAHQTAGRRDAAIAAYDTLLAVDPEHQLATYNLTYALAETPGPGDLDRAAELLEQLKMRWPANAGILYRLGDVHDRRGDTDAAVRYFRAFLDRQEGDEKPRARAKAYVDQHGDAP